MKIFKQPSRNTRALLKEQRGFTIVELVITMLVSVAVLAGVTSSFRNFSRHSRDSFQKNEKNAAIKATLKLLQRDLNMAGFGLPFETRLAEDNLFRQTIESDFEANYHCNADSDSDDPITETCAQHDLNGDGDTSDTMYQDRLYIANGWTILKDITINGDTDGDIATSPQDYFYLVSNKKEKTNGYFTSLIAPVSPSASSIRVDKTNINITHEKNVSTDFKQHKDGGFILFGNDGSGVPVNNLEGHFIGTITGTTLNCSGTDTLAHTYVTADSIVVPAITWYLEKKTGVTPPDTVYWLYRNTDKVLPNVIGFQVSFGYDITNNGLEWFPTVPPATGSVIDGETPDPVTSLKALRAAKIILTLVESSNNDSGKSAMKTYEKVVLLKNN
jgi:type II secretory pathway component PulJ